MFITWANARIIFEVIFMREYRAKYKIESYYYECMTALPAETRYDERLIRAANDIEARKQAQDLRLEVGKGLIQPRVALESLIEIEIKEVTRPVGMKAGKQMDLFR